MVVLGEAMRHSVETRRILDQVREDLRSDLASQSERIDRLTLWVMTATAGALGNLVVGLTLWAIGGK